MDYRGLTVEEVTNLRCKMRDAGVEYKVIKNTMIQRAADKEGIEGLNSILEGPTAVAFGMKDPVSPAKILVDFVKGYKENRASRAACWHGKSHRCEMAMKYLASAALARKSCWRR